MVAGGTGVQAGIEPAGPPILNVTLGSARPVHFAATPVHQWMRTSPSSVANLDSAKVAEPARRAIATAVSRVWKMSSRSGRADQGDTVTHVSPVDHLFEALPIGHTVKLVPWMGSREAALRLP